MRETPFVTFTLVAVLMSSMGAVDAAEEPSLAANYGFLPLEVMKLGDRGSNLLPGDFNHDGLMDLVVIDNTHHRLDLLMQRSEAVPSTKPEGRQDVNRIDDAWRFEQRKLPVDVDVSAVAVGDFDGDKRTDLAYFGLPDQLVIHFQPETGEWLKKQTLRVADVAAGSWCLTAGDLNHDGRDDLVLIGKTELCVLKQRPTGGFEVITRLMNTSEKMGLAQVADLNGDGRADVCYLAGEGTTRGLGVRLQDTTGELGPEYLFDLERPRAVSIRNVDGRPGHEILTIDSRTGRLKILRVVTKTFGPQEIRDRLVRYGFGKGTPGRDRDVALADVDGNGLKDVTVSDPDASRVLLFRQERPRGLDLGTPYPTVSGSDILRAGPVLSKGTADLVVHSASEKSIGIARWDNGRMMFPEVLPIDQEPLGLELVDIDRDGRMEMLYLTKSREGRDSVYTLWGLHRNAGNTDWEEHPTLGGKDGFNVSVKSTPERMLALDVIGDEQPELLLMQGSKPPVVLQLNGAGRFEEVNIGGTVGTGTVSSRAAFPCRLNDRPGLLIAQDNFARHLEVSPQNRWQVGEQINANESAAKIVGAALINLDDTPDPEIALVDTGVKKLRLMQRKNAVYHPWKEIDLGEMAFQRCQVADLNGDERPDLMLFGSDQFAVLYAGGSTPALEEIASYETTLEKAFPTDVVAGDLNGDGIMDLAITDTRSHFLEIVQFSKENSLRHALYFKVFEEKSFQKDDDIPSTEPREAVIADVTGDGLSDLILLVHDRLLVYPQDSGTPPAKK